MKLRYVFLIIILLLSIATLSYPAAFPQQGASSGTWGTELRLFFLPWFDLSTGGSSTIATLPVDLATDVTGSLTDANIASAAAWSAKQDKIYPNIDYSPPLAIGVDVLAPNGSAAALINFPTFTISSGGTGTDCSGCQVGDILSIATVTPTKTFTVISKPTTTGIDALLGYHWNTGLGDFTIGPFSSVSMRVPFTVSTDSPPTSEGWGQWNPTTDAATMGTGSAFTYLCTSATNSCGGGGGGSGDITSVGDCNTGACQTFTMTGAIEAASLGVARANTPQSFTLYEATDDGDYYGQIIAPALGTGFTGNRIITLPDHSCEIDTIDSNTKSPLVGLFYGDGSTVTAVTLGTGLAIAGGVLYTTGTGTSISAYCPSCPAAGSGADVLCEATDGSGDGVCGWTVVETGGATGDVNFATSPDNSPALGCTDIPMTYVLGLTKTNTTNSDCYAYKAVSGTTLYRQFYVKFTAESLADSDDFTIGSFSSASDVTASSTKFSLYQTGGQLYLRHAYHIAAGWQYDSSGSAIALDTWYGVRESVNDTAGSGSTQWWVDYTNNGSWTDQGAATSLTLDRAIGYARYGDAGITVAASAIITGDKIDDDTMPDACTR